MGIQIAFLRAVNVGGHGTVKMADVQRAFAAAGCRDVRTYIQSGNVIFEAAASAALRRKVRERLAKLLGKETEVMFLSRRDLEGVIARAPFGDLVRRADRKLFVAFLARRPRVRVSLPVRIDKEAVEIVAAGLREAYAVTWKKKNGMFGFPNQPVERALGVPATSRAWSTVQRIASLLERDKPS